MNASTLAIEIRKATAGNARQVTHEDDRITVTMVTSFEAEILTGCLNHLRNVKATRLGNDVIIRIDEHGYTERYIASDPEPRP